MGRNGIIFDILVDERVYLEWTLLGAKESSSVVECRKKKYRRKSFWRNALVSSNQLDPPLQSTLSVIHVLPRLHLFYFNYSFLYFFILFIFILRIVPPERLGSTRETISTLSGCYACTYSFMFIDYGIFINISHYLFLVIDKQYFIRSMLMFR